MKFFGKNYLSRKLMIVTIIILCFISLVLLSILSANFVSRIEFERNWILEGFFEPTTTMEQKIETSFANSQAFQLKSLFIGFMSINMLMIFSVLIISLIAAIKIFKEKSNVIVETRISLIILSVLLIVFFIFLSLQPTDVNRSIFVEAFGQTINDVLERMSYSLGFITYVLIVFSFILNIMARKRFGFLTKDKILAKKFIDTSELENKINQILSK